MKKVQVNASLTKNAFYDSGINLGEVIFNEMISELKRTIRNKDRKLNDKPVRIQIIAETEPKEGPKSKEQLRIEELEKKIEDLQKQVNKNIQTIPYYPINNSSFDWNWWNNGPTS